MKTIEFIGGQTCPESIPIQGLIDSTRNVLTRRGEQLVSYPFQVDQHDELRQIASKRFMHREGIPLPTDNIVVTNGSMQSITLLTQILTSPGDTIITEELSYLGSLKYFRFYGLNIVGIPLDPVEGMNMDALEKTLGDLSKNNKKPKFIYTISNHQNPTGAIMSLSRRNRLVQLVKEYGIPIIQDDCYGDVDFEPNPVPPSLLTLGNENANFFVGSFSKILAPGLRLGYCYVPQDFLEEISDLKKFLDLGSSALTSFIVAEYLRDNLWSHIEKHNAIIKDKLEVLLSAMEENLADQQVNWNRPKGGLFVWVKLPDSIDLKTLEQLAEQNGVAYDAGREFHYREEDINYLRLSYAHLAKEDIIEGVRILARCIKDAI